MGVSKTLTVNQEAGASIESGDTIAIQMGNAVYKYSIGNVTKPTESMKGTIQGTFNQTLGFRSGDSLIGIVEHNGGLVGAGFLGNTLKMTISASGDTINCSKISDTTKGWMFTGATTTDINKIADGGPRMALYVSVLTIDTDEYVITLDNTWGVEGIILNSICYTIERIEGAGASLVSLIYTGKLSAIVQGLTLRKDNAAVDAFAIDQIESGGTTESFTLIQPTPIDAQTVSYNGIDVSILNTFARKMENQSMDGNVLDFSLDNTYTKQQYLAGLSKVSYK